MNPFERTRRLVAAAHLAILGSVTPFGCSGGSGEAPAPVKESTGSIKAALQIDPGLTLNAVSYSITGPSGFTKTGTIGVQNSTTLSAVIGPIPAGIGFTIALTSTATDGTTTCGGSANFAVTPGQTTVVAIHLACHEQPRTGSVLLTGSLNICPSIDGIGASPGETFVGGSIQLTGSAHDLDHAPSSLVYAWSTDLGTLSDPTAQNPSLTCTLAGTAHIMLSVSDGDALCSETRSISVVCTPAADGG